MRLLFFFLFPVILFASAIESPLIKRMGDDKAIISVPMIDVGVSGFIVHRFNSEHSAIVASAVVSDFNPETAEATLTLSPYDGLRQNSLPSGNWRPEVGDFAILAFDYERAMLIAPSEEIYHQITKRITTLDWVHPDGFAAYLSYRGHPTPLAEDMQGYCSVASIGLIYLYSAETLFTIDCKSLTLLQLTPAPFSSPETPKLPFYSRVEKIEANWFGKGSSTLESYEPYYLELLVLNNPKDSKLYHFIKSNDSLRSVLLDEFEIEE